MKKITRSISHGHGSADQDPDPHQNVMDPQNCCKDNPIGVLPEKKLRGLSPNFHIHVSVSHLYISTIVPPIFLQHNRQTDGGNI
jgi:hypothetical protein